MKKLLTLLLFLTISASAQIKFSKIINTGINSNDVYIGSGNSKLFSAKINDIILLYAIDTRNLSKEVIQRKQRIHYISDSKDNVSSYFYYPESALNQTIYDARFIDKYLFIVTTRNIFVYEKTKENYSLKKEIINEYKYSEVDKVNDSTLLFSVAYIFHPKSQKEKVVLSTFNIRNLEFTKTIQPTIHGIEYSYFSPSWITSINNKIAIVNDPMSYNIAIFDNSFNKLYDITPNYPNWKIISEDSLAYISKFSGKDAIDVAQKIDKNISRVISVLFLDSNNLCVVYKLEGVYKDIYYDIFEINDKRFTIVYKNNLIKVDNEEEDNIGNSQLMLYPLKNRRPQIIETKNKEFITFTTNYFEFSNDITVKEYFDKVKLSRQKDNKTIGIMKYTW